MGTKGVPFGYLEFSSAFGEKPCPRHPITAQRGVGVGVGVSVGPFFLDRAALGSHSTGCGSCGCERENPEPELGHANAGEKPDPNWCTPTHF